MTTALDTNKLILTIPDLKARNPTQFLLDLAFRLTAMSDTEAVSVDIKKGRRIIAPLVSPKLPGKLMEKNATETRTIKPAYVKPKFVVDPSETMKRLGGEPLNGTMSPQQRLDAITAERLADGIAYVDRRLEWMAAKALVSGAITLVGDQYPSTSVDFQRDASLTSASPATDWDANGAAPLDDLDTLNSLMIQKSGLGTTDIIMDPKAWILFRKDAAVKALLQNFPAQQNAVQVNAGGRSAEGGQFMGQIGNWRLWQYQSWYIDPADDTEKVMIPDNTVICVNAEGVAGVRHFGCIRDVAALYATPYFPKVWDEDDPSFRYAMIQSAPLVSLERPDASASMTVT